ncbi:MAG: hypothetical protein JKY65_00340 [Planctomycetes bacterium]|nr:hypothetical protein [Planctomycetota bacterium]
MRFEVQNALSGLDQRTPEYYRTELFAHGSLEVRQDAIEALSSLDPEHKTTQALREMLKLT